MVIKGFERIRNMLNPSFVSSDYRKAVIKGFERLRNGNPWMSMPKSMHNALVMQNGGSVYVVP